MTMMDKNEQAIFLRTLSEWTREQIAAAVEPLQRRIEQLERCGKQYVGSYQRSIDFYTRGMVVTYQGQEWTCVMDVTRPGEIPGKSVCWQLSHKLLSKRDAA